MPVQSKVNAGRMDSSNGHNVDLSTLIILVVSTLGFVLVAYVVLTTLSRFLERPSLLIPGKRAARIRELQETGAILLEEPLADEDKLAVQRALNTLAMQRTSEFTGPWSKSNPILDAEHDILSVQHRIQQTT